MTGSDAYLPIMADCERGLGRPERALDLVRSREAERLDREGRIELTIVESGARRDLGQLDAAVITLQRLPELRDTRPQPWSARLAFAYADALAHAGHQAAAIEWFERAVDFDEEGETDAAERYAELTGTAVDHIEDIEDAEDAEEEVSAEGDASHSGLVANGEDVELDDLADLNAQLEEDDTLEAGQEPVAGEKTSSEEASDDEVPAADAVIEAASESTDGDEARSAEVGEAAEGQAPGAEPAPADQSAPESESEPASETDVVKPGVGPAFIEPDYGDVLDEAAPQTKREE
ncbi:hypothetical protein [Sinosporangium album]|uniref:hypothetical protein n=1 Tax=Sinosporangium album TaxID=504805 RepID=UPI001FE03737|nr:hypothetical protein [Sinosporangium album]